VSRGAGSVAGRDAIVVHQVWAAYTHLHATSTPEWARGLLGAARTYALGMEPARNVADGV
jgi:cobyrinic acid a,c-diamide synthase